MKPQSSLKHLLVSQTRLKLITTLFYFPKEIYYVRQLVRLLDEEINSVRRELDNLKKANIVESEWRGNRLYYWANSASPLFPELLTIANKSTGLGFKLQSKNNGLGQIKLLMYSYKFISGQRKNPDDIDLIIVGDVSYKEIENNMKQEEEIRKHEINYMIMDKSELELRIQKRDQFIVDFFLDCPMVIIGSPQDISNI
jgi:DNA-binding transcriptional ArsR family regulator